MCKKRVVYEILDEIEHPDILLACCGGGGFLAGTGLAIANSKLNTLVYGVEPENGLKYIAIKQFKL